MKVLFLALISSCAILLGCSCGSRQPATPSSLPAEYIQTSLDEREQHRLLVNSFAERTVSIRRDCKVKEGVVVLVEDVNPEYALDGAGTGVIVRSYAERSYIFTAAHVVVVGNKYKKYFTCDIHVTLNKNLGDTGARMKATVIAYDLERDVAVLKVGSNLEVNTELEEHPYVGEPVWAVGYPMQPVYPKFKALSVTEGSLATLNIPAGPESGHYHRVTTQIYFGNSGGGVWNASGRLVGIAVGLISVDDVPMEGQYFIKPVSEFILTLKSAWKYWEVFDD